LTEFGKFDVRDPEIEARLATIGYTLREAIEAVPGYGFALLIFQYGEGGNMFYTSSAQRDDVIAAMKEFIEKHEPR
jgi:hypothetical protein